MIHYDHCGSVGLLEVIARLKELGVRYVAPGHRSETDARRLFKEAYKD